MNGRSPYGSVGAGPQQPNVHGQQQQPVVPTSAVRQHGQQSTFFLFSR
jgi:hypothetical protein